MAFTPGLPPGFTYSVTTTPTGGTGSGTVSPISITNLIGNKSYTFTLTAYRMTLSKSATSGSYLMKPDAVTIGTVTSLEITTASVGYTAPTGGAAKYEITTSPAGGTGNTVVGLNPIPVTGLTGNTTYTFTVTASNTTGSSTSTTAGSYLTKPDLVTIGAVSSITSSSASVAYTAPTGGAAAYTITTSPAGGTGTGASPISVTGLAANTSYTFTVTASNATGSNVSTSGSYVTKPGDPTLGTITVTGFTASVAYTAPTGGATTYTVYTSPVGGTGSSATSPISVTGLSANTTYSFVIYASNAAGTSSMISSGSTYLTVPNPPTLGTITISDLTASVGFTGSSGGATSYAVYTSPAGGTGTGTTSPISVTGLASNTVYTFNIYAINSKGSSTVASSASTYLTRPDEPTIGTVTISETATISETIATVPFTAPSGNGTITNYIVTSNPSSITGSGTTSPISVSGLARDTTYTFTITATNATGTSVPSLISNQVYSRNFYRYYKFTPVTLMGSEPYVQLSEFIIGYNSARVDYTGATASNPGGDNPSNETPAQGIDNNVDTKWLDRKIGSLIIDFKGVRVANMYTFSTANDVPGRDPKTWAVWGSNDNSSWTGLDVQTNYNTTTARKTQLPWFNFL